MLGIFNEADAQKVIMEFKQALATGYGIAPDQMTGIGPLRLESLSKYLTLLPPTVQKFCPVWNKLARSKANSVVELFNVVSSFGLQHPFGAAVAEGEVGTEKESTYERKAAFIKYFSTVRKITGQALLVNNVAGGAEQLRALENSMAMQYLIQQIETQLLFGNSRLAPGGGEGLELDGFNTAVTTVLDAGGNPLTYDLVLKAVSQLTQGVYPAFPNQIFCSWSNANQLAASASQYIRYMIGLEKNIDLAAGVPFGLKISPVITPAGEIDVAPAYYIKFISEYEAPNSAIGTPPSNTPELTVTAEETPSGAYWGKRYGAGLEVSYVVCGANSLGISAKSEAVTITFGGENGANLNAKLTLSITNPVSNLPDYYLIFRNDTYEGKSTGFKLIGRVARSTSASTTFIDDGFKIPGTHVAFIGQNDADTVEVKTLSDMIEFTLPPLAFHVRWALLMLVGVLWKAPMRWIKIENLAS